jgi:hypothetical protein
VPWIVNSLHCAKRQREACNVAREMGLGRSQLNDLHGRRLGWEQDDLVWRCTILYSMVVYIYVQEMHARVSTHMASLPWSSSHNSAGRLSPFEQFMYTPCMP